MSGRRKEDSMQEQVKHEKTALDQTIHIDLSRGPCDHPPMREVGGGNWSRKDLAKLTLTYLFQLAS